MKTTFWETKSALDVISSLNLKLQTLRIAAGMLAKHGTLWTAHGEEK